MTGMPARIGGAFPLIGERELPKVRTALESECTVVYAYFDRKGSETAATSTHSASREAKELIDRLTPTTNCSPSIPWNGKRLPLPCLSSAKSNPLAAAYICSG